MLVLYAKKKARRLKIVGWLISSFSFILIIMSLLLLLYRSLENDTSFLRDISLFINNLIAHLYHSIPSLKPVWDFAPVIYYPNILVQKNLTFLLLIFIFILGLGIRATGIGLMYRMNKIVRKAEEKRMEMELTGEVINKDILSIEIENKSEDNWYKRPMGVISLTVIAGSLVNLLWSFTTSL